MVSFVCDACQETLKKPKLDAHKARCRWAQFSCVDCSVTFQGTDYRAHTSCISEAEKYQKSLYRGKKQNNNKNQNQNKNQQQQQQQKQNQTSAPAATTTTITTTDSTTTSSSPAATTTPTPTKPTESKKRKTVSSDSDSSSDSSSSSSFESESEAVSKKKGANKKAKVEETGEKKEEKKEEKKDKKKKEKKEKKKEKKEFSVFDAAVEVLKGQGEADHEMTLSKFRKGVVKKITEGCGCEKKEAMKKYNESFKATFVDGTIRLQKA